MKTLVFTTPFDLLDVSGPVSKLAFKKVHSGTGEPVSPQPLLPWHATFPELFAAPLPLAGRSAVYPALRAEVGALVQRTRRRQLEDDVRIADVEMRHLEMILMKDGEHLLLQRLYLLGRPWHLADYNAS